MKKTKRQRDVPAIRFPGFTDSWEQRKLGELCNITTGKLDANAMVSDGQYDFYTSGIDVFKIGVAVFEGPAITIAGNGASVGYMHLTDGKFNAYQRTYVLTDFLADRQFLNVAIGNELPDKIQEEVRGSGIPYIVLNMLTDLAIPFPSHEEQYAIGVYFQQLDNLITLQERKCRVLRELKKCMLQKMFPKNGSDIPEIRFPGFTDSWEQRKLGDLGSLKNGMNFSKDAMGHGCAFVNLQNIFGNNVVDVKSLGLAEASEKQLLEYSLQKGDVLFVRSSVKLEGVGEAALVAETLENTTYSGFIIRFRDEYGLNNDFKKFVFVTKKVRDQIMSQATNSANKNISQSVLENLTFEIPSKDEQKQIGEYFSSLDNLITLQERKCKVLRELKKCMLQKMFV